MGSAWIVLKVSPNEAPHNTAAAFVLLFVYVLSVCVAPFLVVRYRKAV
jgi:hypothetical protein